jgi:hypothetical protein
MMGVPDQVAWDVEVKASFEQCRMELVAMKNMPVQILFFAAGPAAPEFQTQGVLSVRRRGEALHLGLDGEPFTRLKGSPEDFITASVAPGHVRMLYATVVVTVRRTSLLFHMREEAERGDK